jgi:hypothetical protein
MRLSTKLLLSLALCIALGVGGWQAFESIKRIGMDEVRRECERVNAAIETVVHKQAEEQQKVVTRYLTQYVERAAEERVVYRDIVKEVPVYVPSDLPVLPAGVRVLHDAAATGRALPETGDSSRADATPVTPQDLTRTVAENYASCREDQGRLEALQGIIKTFAAD